MAGSAYVKFAPKLTKRELEVIEAILAGALRYKSIASALNISVNTVKTHLRKIYKIVGVNKIETLAYLFNGYTPNKTEITLKSPQKNTNSPQIGDRKQHIFAVTLYNILHSGSRKMQKFNTLRTRTVGAVFMVSVFALVIGFMAIRLISRSLQTNTEFGVTAITVPDGILLTFSNIPDDTTDLSITFVDINAKDKSETSVVLNYEAFDEVKKTRNLLCPFAANGREYLIRVYRLTGFEMAEKIVTGAIAGGGIYLTNTPLLHFENENNTFLLSEMPIFSEKVVFSQNGFLNYYTYVISDIGGYIGIGGDATNSLISSVSIQPNEDTARMFSDFLTGNLPLYGTAHCLLEYKNMEWIVQVARSEDVIVAF